MFGFWEIAIVGCLVLVLFFGASRIPEIARSFGLGIREFKKGLQAPDKEDPLPPPRSPSDED